MGKLNEEIKRLNQSKKIKIRINKSGKGYSLYLEYNSNWKRERQFLHLILSGKATLTKADKKVLYEAEIIRDLKELEEFGQKDTFVLNNKVSEADFIEYFKNVSQENKLPSYNGSLKKLEVYVRLQNRTSYLNFSSITPKFCTRFRDYLIALVNKKQLANQTAKTYMTVFAATLNRAVADGIISINPASKIRIKEVESKREFLNEQELKQLIMVDTKYTEIKNAFIFASQTSLRLGDIRALMFKDIRFENETNAYLYLRTQKTKGVANIKLSNLAIEIYKKQKEKHPKESFVFKLPSARSFLNKKIREIAEEAGIQKHIHFHVSRHTWATLAMSRGVDIYTVSKIMGHSSVAVTEIYANLIDKKRDEVANIINIEITEEDRNGKK